MSNEQTSITNFTKSAEKALRVTHATMRPVFERAASNFVEALLQFLQERNIPILTITSRVKDIESCVAKAKRKNYRDPSDIEDFVGIRIICFYVTDIKKILDLIDDEFVVAATEDKVEALAPDQFGYRSSHKIVRIKPGWAQTPNYRGLDQVKCEVQVRTMLMHAWAEISHKLSYKKSHDVPTQLARELSRLSAKLEDADEQFESIYQRARAYEASLQQDFMLQRSTAGIELNVDSVKAFARNRFADREFGDDSEYSDLLGEIKTSGYSSIGQLEEMLDRSAEVFLEFEREDGPAGDGSDAGRYSDIGAIRTQIYMMHPETLRISVSDSDLTPEEIEETLSEYRGYGEKVGSGL